MASQMSPCPEEKLSNAVDRGEIKIHSLSPIMTTIVGVTVALFEAAYLLLAETCAMLNAQTFVPALV